MTADIQATYTFTTLNRNDFVALIYNRYGKKLYSYALNKWKMSEDEAWELIYKTLYKVSESYKQLSFENENKFASFVFRVFINYLRNHYRDTQKTATLAEDAERAAATAGAGNKTDDTDNKQLLALKGELEKMEDWQRVLLLMRSGGAPYAEIATYVNKPEEQLKVYYQRLKEQISKKLNGKS